MLRCSNRQTTKELVTTIIFTEARSIRAKTRRSSRISKRQNFSFRITIEDYLTYRYQRDQC